MSQKKREALWRATKTVGKGVVYVENRSRIVNDVWEWIKSFWYCFLVQSSQLERKIMTLSSVAIFLVAFLHIGFFILESILWTSPKIMRIFENTKESAEVTRVLALNQGFYNLGASLLLLWFHFSNNPSGLMSILVFLFFMGLFWEIFIFLTIFSFLRVVRPWFFLSTHSLEFRECFEYL